jgi:hypothetical protein
MNKKNKYIYDIQILRIQNFGVNGLLAYFDSERAEKKNLIYISHESEILNEINRRIASLVIYHIHIFSISKDKILCEIHTPEENKKIEFSYPDEELVEKYYLFRKETLNKVLKRQ